MASAAQKKAQANFKKAIAYRKKTGCTLKQAFAYAKGGKVGAAKKKVAKKKTAVKKVVRKKAAPKKATKKTLKYQGVIKKKSGNEYAYKLGGANVDQINRYSELCKLEKFIIKAIAYNLQIKKEKNNPVTTSQIIKLNKGLKKELAVVKKQKAIQKTLI